MKRQALTLGFFATGAQVLLLRELVSSLNGSELFVGVALGGWLIAVAAGALIGGKTTRSYRWRSTGLALGACALPPLIAILRITPLTVTSTPGQSIPFTLAVVVSVLAMCPAGVLSGLLFSAIAGSDTSAERAVLTVYLWEGIGACASVTVAGVAVGCSFSTMQIAVVVASLTSAAVCAGKRPATLGLAVAIAAAGLALAVVAVPKTDVFLDGMKFPRYAVARCFDTKYGHQALLYRDSSYALLTDNMVEAVWPDQETAENQLIVPLIYAPRARNVLFMGRAEFGLDVLASRLSGITLTAVDPRTDLDRLPSFHPGTATRVRRIDADAASFLTGAKCPDLYDAIVIPLGDPGSYRISRLVTSTALAACKKRLSPHGIVCVSVNYDTERYAADATVRALSAIRASVGRVFTNVIVWPGPSTLLLASEDLPLALPYDSIVARINSLAVEPQYVNDSYLFDRLNAFNRQRLDSALATYPATNSLTKPLLPHLQMLHASRRSAADRAIIAAILDKPTWLVAVPVAVAILFLFCLGSGSQRRYPLFLFFTAGLVSLAIVLIAFYLYQSTAGALYSHMSLLIGAYMLGLSLGAYCVVKSRTGVLAVPALGTLLVSVGTIFFILRTPPEFALFAYMSVLILAAASASVVFAEAAKQYYAGARSTGRGLGYAWELAGSACGACVTTTIALPTLGLNGILTFLLAVLVLALAGSIVSSQRTAHRS